MLAGLGAFALARPGMAQERVTIPLAPHAVDLGRRQVDFVCVEGTGQVVHMLEATTPSRRVRPYSTFKIPNAIIGLETGVATGPDHLRVWDPQRHPPAPHWPGSWQRDHTLASAFQDSVVWYFEDMARDIGQSAYRERLAQWQYGNGEVAPGAFWLNGTLAISAFEQIAFLSNVSAGTLGLASATQSAIEDITRDGEIAGIPVHGKTGAGPLFGRGFGGPYGGWYVGWMRPEGRAELTFALYVEAPTFREIGPFRRAFAARLIEDILARDG